MPWLPPSPWKRRLGGDGKANIACSTAKWSSVVGGQINKVAGFNSNVLSGCNNKSTGNCSVVLGGSGSCDNGFNYVGVFGCNVVAVAANTFHVECLNAVKTPNVGGLFPSGTVYWKDASLLVAGDRVLLIQP